MVPLTVTVSTVSNTSALLHRMNGMTQTVELADFISDYIVEYMEAPLIRRMIVKREDYNANLDVDKVIQFCKQMLNDLEVSADAPESGFHNRRAYIQHQLLIYLESNSHLDLDGFIYFRLKKYISDLQDIVDEALQEFMLNEQYQEFIALLKYFVFFQDTKIAEVHLIHLGDNKFQLLDGNLQQLDISESKEVVIETVDRELNYEDMDVSALISASPKQIHIHTRDPDTQSIKTIQQIFEGRTSICERLT